MVAASEKRGPRRRAQRRGVKVVVSKPACCHPIQGRGWNRPAEGAGRTEARIIGQDQQNVRCAGWRCHCFGKVRLGFAGLAADHSTKSRFGRWEYYRTTLRRRRALCECWT